MKSMGSFLGFPFVRALILALGLGGSLGSTECLAQVTAPHPGFGVWIAQCQMGTSADSYGLGIALQFEAPRTQSLAAYAFEPCLGIGRRVAAATLSEADHGFGPESCQREFRDGFQNGLEANGLALGSGCRALGYSAGVAVLRTAVRNQLAGWVSPWVLRAYSQGASDAVQRRMMQTPTSPAAEREAYLAGYWDGSGF
jgi:hypothetical protein